MARFVLVLGTSLVALAEIPRVVEPDRLDWIVPLDSLFRNSAVGGTLVLTSLGYLVTTALLRAREAGRTAPLFTVVTVLLPLWILQVIVLGAVAATRALDTLAPPTSLTGEMWSAVLTFRWNLWITDHMLEIPPELVGLALLSIAAQLVALLAVVVVLLPVRWNRILLAFGAGLTAFVVAGLRVRAAEVQDPYVLLLDTFARSDAFFLGVVVACAAGLGPRVSPSASSGALVALVGSVLAAGFVSTELHLVLHLPVTALLAGLALLDDGTVSDDLVLPPLIGSREVALVAVVWAPLLACATPAAVIIGRRTEMHWILRVIVLIIVIAIITRVASATARRLPLPERPPIGVQGLRDAWRRVVAEADASVTDTRHPQASGEDRDEDRRPRSEQPPGA